MAPFSVVIGNVITDFEPRFGQAGETAAVEQFGLEAAPKGFGVRVVITVAAPAHALQRAMFGNQPFESRGRVLAALVGAHNEPSGRPAQGQSPAQRFADQVFGHRVTHVPA